MRKFTTSELQAAVDACKLLRYFPGDAGGQTEAMRLLAKMVPHYEALRWLVDTLINSVNDWPGPVEVRGLLCTRYKPADGVERDCSIPGFRPSDFEAREIEATDEERRKFPERMPDLKRIAAGDVEHANA